MHGAMMSQAVGAMPEVVSPRAVLLKALDKLSPADQAAAVEEIVAFGETGLLPNLDPLVGWSAMLEGMAPEQAASVLAAWKDALEMSAPDVAPVGKAANASAVLPAEDRWTAALSGLPQVWQTVLNALPESSRARLLAAWGTAVSMPTIPGKALLTFRIKGTGARVVLKMGEDGLPRFARTMNITDIPDKGGVTDEGACSCGGLTTSPCDHGSSARTLVERGVLAGQVTAAQAADYLRAHNL